VQPWAVVALQFAALLGYSDFLVRCLCECSHLSPQLCATSNLSLFCSCWPILPTFRSPALSLLQAQLYFPEAFAFNAEHPVWGLHFFDGTGESFACVACLVFACRVLLSLCLPSVLVLGALHCFFAWASRVPNAIQMLQLASMGSFLACSPLARVRSRVRLSNSGGRSLRPAASQRRTTPARAAKPAVRALPALPLLLCGSLP
jgi:hypothetical protein